MSHLIDAPASAPTETPESVIGVAASTEAPRGLTSGEFTTILTVGAMIAVLGFIGFVNSFIKVADAAEPFFGELAATVPIGIDIGILAFSALDIVLARLDMRVRLLRFIPWALTAVTIYLNIAGETDSFAIVAHAILPMLWVVAVEVGAHVLRKFAGLSSVTRMDSIRKSRWIFAFPSTFFLWRRMILWEIRSYPLALQRERDRLLAKTELQDRYGKLWRFKASRRERALFRLGELVPTAIEIEDEEVAVPEDEEVAVPQDEEISSPEDRPEDQKDETEDEPVRPRGRRRPRTEKSEDRPEDKPEDGTEKKRSVPSIEDLVPIGTEVAQELAENARPLTRDNLVESFRVRGHGISTGRATALLAYLKEAFASGEAGGRPDGQLDLVQMAGVE